MKNWSNDDLTFAWFVGLYEGDGSLNTRSGRSYIGIDVTDEDIVRTLQNRFGGKIYGPLVKKNKDMLRRGFNIKPMWQWRLHTQAEVWPILNAMYPYLSQRRRERIDVARLAYAAIPNKKPRASKPRIDCTFIADAESQVV